MKPVLPVPFAEYKDKFPHVKMERSDDGILLLTFHNGQGDEFEWSFAAHHETAYLWRYVGDDPENKVVILTGSGNAFLRNEFRGEGDSDRDTMANDPAARAAAWVDTYRHAKRLVMDLLDIEQPMIAALNGPVTFHAEIPLLCDIVLAAEHTVIADAIHFELGWVPGDGVQTLFPLLMGYNRARYFMLTGQQLSAQQSLDFGLINEILPREQVVPRAYELARQILKSPPMTVRLFRPVVTQQLKRLAAEGFSQGFMSEGLAFTVNWPQGVVRAPTTPYDVTS